MIKPKSDFSKNVLTLMTGTTIAQAIPVAISPILTRMYSPEQFGVLAIFIAISTIFGSIATGKYELAIMLPKKEDDAIHIFALGLILNSTLSIFLLIIILFLHDSILVMFNNQEISLWLYWIPVAVFFTGLYNLYVYINNRKKNYKKLAEINILRSTMLVTTQLLVGFLKSGVAGLISGQLIANFIGVLGFINGKEKSRRQFSFSKISKARVFALAKKYNKFPKFTLWAGLANVSATHVTNILISSLYGLTTLGFYSFVQRLLGMPSALIGASIGQVFFQEASEEKRKTGRAVRSFYTTMKKLIAIGLPSFCVLYFIIEELFAFAFGEGWRVAGVYAKTLTPLFLVVFVVSPLTVVNQVNLKNKLGMLWQFGLLMLYTTLVFISSQLDFSFKELINMIVIWVSAYYLFFLYLINKHVNEY